MVNTARVLEEKLGGNLAKYLSLPQVMDRLGVTRTTIYKWIAEGRLKARKDDWGGRIQFKFLPEEIERIEGLLKPRREKGKSIVEDQ
jgi:excisionase family DNA binding protein